MQSLRLNPILNTDSYKLTHWWQYPPDTRHIYSYVESRGGMFDETMMAMLQYIVKSNFAGQVFTMGTSKRPVVSPMLIFRGIPNHSTMKASNLFTPSTADAFLYAFAQ